MKALLVISGLLLVAMGCSSTTDTTASMASVTLAEVNQHHAKADCWLVIENQVYDVTEFIDQHPGGDRIVEGCGQDATDLFTGKNLVGHIHSALARSMLKQYQIGDLVE